MTWHNMNHDPQFFCKTTFIINICTNVTLALPWRCFRCSTWLLCRIFYHLVVQKALAHILQSYHTVASYSFISLCGFSGKQSALQHLLWPWKGLPKLSGYLLIYQMAICGLKGLPFINHFSFKFSVCADEIIKKLDLLYKDGEMERKRSN